MNPQTRPSETMMLLVPLGALAVAGMAIFGGPKEMLVAFDGFFRQLFAVGADVLHRFL